MQRLTIAMALALVVLLAACGQSTSTKPAEQSNVDQTNRQLKVLNDGQPVPFFDYSQIRQTLIEVRKAEANTVGTWSVFYSLGKPVFSCQSIGFPIPATDELTNPEQIVGGGASGSYWGAPLAQAEPTGIYTGPTDGTYVACVLPSGDIAPIYSEPSVMTFPFPVHIENDQVVEDAGGKPTFTVPKH